MIPRPLALLLWRSLAVLCVVVVFLPGLPTVPSLLVAAWAGGRGWPALEDWLLNHPRHGPGIRRWRERGAVPRRAKWAASGMMLASAGVLQLSPVARWSKVAVPALMAAVVLWLSRRPEWGQR